MTSKEALTIFKEIYKDRNASLASAKEFQDKCDEDTKHIWDADIDYFQTEVNLYERIIQDLETLEAYREFKDYIKQIPIGCVMFTDELYSELEQIEQCGEFCDGKN